MGRVHGYLFYFLTYKYKLFITYMEIFKFNG